MVDQKIDLRFVLAATIAVAFTWMIHELAHWLTSEALGHDTVMRLNGTSLADGDTPPDHHRILISAAGPVVTILQAVLVFLVLRSKGWIKNLYPFLFTPFYMRLLAGLMNFVNPNDEGRISAALNLGTFTLPLIVSGLLFVLVLIVSGKHDLNWKFQLGTVLAVMVASSVLILSDQFLHIRIL